MYAMICIRLSIVQVVGIVDRFMVDLDKEHCNVVKRTLRYIKGASDVALCFIGSELIIRGLFDLHFVTDHLNK